jgi:hypothetical protein
MTPPAESDRTAVEAGAGRPFRFSLVLGDGEGRLLYWFGGKWAALLGTVVVALFGAMGLTFAALWPGRPVAAEFLAFASAGIGALAVAHHFRPRTVLFERREGTWRWRERGILSRVSWRSLGWSSITDQEPLRLEREPRSTVEGWTLYAGTVRLFSYLGDPSIGRSVSAAFQSAGVPLRTVMRRPVEE